MQQLIRVWLFVVCTLGLVLSVPMHTQAQEVTDPTATPVAQVATDPATVPDAPQIVGGSDATQGEFPWQAMLLIGREQYFSCGGTLVARDWIVTAAHCLTIPQSGGKFLTESPENVLVVMGGHLLNATNPNEQVRYAKQLIIHPSYNSATENNDIALIQLRSPVTLNEYVSTIRVANNSDAALYSSGSITVTGWGTTSSGGDVSNTLQKVNIPIVSNAQCSEMYGSNGSITANMFCAGDTTVGGIDSCQGDSGGPAIKNDANGRPILVGVVSWGTGCADPLYPGVYAKVSALNLFITGKVGKVDQPTITASSTRTPSYTRTPSNTRTASLTRTSTVTRSPNLTRTATNTFIPSNTRTLSSTRTASNTRTPSLTRSRTITRTPTSTPGYFDNILNGSFEDATGSDANNWEEESAYGFHIFDTSYMLTARTGDNVVWMGGAYSETTTITQTVTVESSGKYLAFYYKTISTEPCGMYSDLLYVNASDTEMSMPPEYIYMDVCKTTVKPTWTKKVLDLSQFVGKSVVLVFSMSNDTSLHSHIFIDDIGFIPNPGVDVNYRNLPPPRLAPETLVDRRRTR